MVSQESRANKRCRPICARGYRSAKRLDRVAMTFLQCCSDGAANQGHHAPCSIVQRKTGMSPQGHFVWYELITADMPAARRFYASVIGWEMRDASMPGMAYTLCSTARGSVCGFVDVAAEAMPAGEKPCWIGYIGVDDGDAATTRAITHGGVVEVAPQTIPEVSRFAILTDPQFVPFGVLKWLMPRPQPAAPDTPGEIGWHELLARDEAGAF